MVLQKELHGLPGHLMIIHEKNAFHDGRASPERLRAFDMPRVNRSVVKTEV
jgi:hypothetical protein